MEKAFHSIIVIFVVCTLVGIFFAINAPRPKLSFNERLRLSEVIDKCNADLPCEIGTIGYLDSLSFEKETITYYGAPDKPRGAEFMALTQKLLIIGTFDH